MRLIEWTYRTWFSFAILNLNIISRYWLPNMLLNDLLKDDQRTNLSLSTTMKYASIPTWISFLLPYFLKSRKLSFRELVKFFFPIINLLYQCSLTTSQQPNIHIEHTCLQSIRVTSVTPAQGRVSFFTTPSTSLHDATRRLIRPARNYAAFRARAPGTRNHLLVINIEPAIHTRHVK